MIKTSRAMAAAAAAVVVVVIIVVACMHKIHLYLLEYSDRSICYCFIVCAASHSIRR